MTVLQPKTPIQPHGNKHSAIDALPALDQEYIRAAAETITYLNEPFVSRERQQEAVLDLVNEIVSRLQDRASQAPLPAGYRVVCTNRSIWGDQSDEALKNSMLGPKEGL